MLAQSPQSALGISFRAVWEVSIVCALQNPKRRDCPVAFAQAIGRRCLRAITRGVVEGLLASCIGKSARTFFTGAGGRECGR